VDVGCLQQTPDVRRALPPTHTLTVPLCVDAGYAIGYFHGAMAVAYDSDYVMDLIPCDVVAALTLAVAAKAAAVAGTAEADTVPIYHACSAHCNPCPLGTVFDCNKRFWTRNPPPLTLPPLK
jgi:hypothetical protein